MNLQRQITLLLIVLITSSIASGQGVEKLGCEVQSGWKYTAGRFAEISFGKSSFD